MMKKSLADHLWFSVLMLFVSVCILASAIAAVTGRIQVLPDLTHTGPAGLTAPTESLRSVFNWAVTTGTNANQMDMLFIDQRTLAASTNETLDLYNSLVDNFGTTLDFARVKMLALSSASANGADIEMGGSAGGAFTNWCGASNDVVKIAPGGTAVFVAPDVTGFPVTDGTGDKLLITNTSTNSVTYDVYIGGSSG